MTAKKTSARKTTAAKATKVEEVVKSPYDDEEGLETTSTPDDIEQPVIPPKEVDDTLSEVSDTVEETSATKETNEEDTTKKDVLIPPGMRDLGKNVSARLLRKETDSTLDDDEVEESSSSDEDEIKPTTWSVRRSDDIPVVKDKNKDDKILTVADTAIMSVGGLPSSAIKSMEKLIPENLTKSPYPLLWGNVVGYAEARNHMPTFKGHNLEGAVQRPNALWANRVNFGSAEEPSYKGMVSDKSGGSEKRGNTKNAISLWKALNVLKIGNPVYVPLYQTGIWIRVNVPTPADYVKLEEAINAEKQYYGASTRGEIFSNENILYRKHVANFILEHVDETTAPDSSIEYLKSIIKVTDLDVMMVALQQARYPDGYPFAQACTVDPNECTHVVTGEIDLRELVWTDETKLTAKQRKLMNNPRRKITEEQLLEYQQEFNLVDKRKIIITTGESKVNELGEIINGVVINIEEPTLDKDEEYGVEFINSLVSNAENIFKEKSDYLKRKQRIEDDILVTYFKTYGSWIKSIEVYQDGVQVGFITDDEEDGKEKLDEMLKHLSSDQEYVRLFRNEIRKYIDENIITVVGILNYECPSCGRKHNTTKADGLILPLDVLNLFFTQIRRSVTQSYQKIAI